MVLRIPSQTYAYATLSRVIHIVVFPTSVWDLSTTAPWWAAGIMRRGYLGSMDNGNGGGGGIAGQNSLGDLIAFVLLVQFNPRSHCFGNSSFRCSRIIARSNPLCIWGRGYPSRFVYQLLPDLPTHRCRLPQSLRCVRFEISYRLGCYSYLFDTWF